MMHLDCRTDNWPAPPSEYEKQVLDFCRAWRAGESSFVLHTSGSTGTPKPIHLTRTQMEASARLTGQTFGLVPGDRALVCLNIRYVAGIMMLVRGLELGLQLTIVEPDANPFGTLLPEYNTFEFAAFVPLQLQTLLNTTNALPVLNTMKAILVGGAAVSPLLEEDLQRINVPVYSTYGMTETVSHIAVRRVNGPERTTLFTPLRGVELGIDNRSCLNIRAAATDFALIQTNDVVELLPNGKFRLLGRADAIINSGGVKIQPEQVEGVVFEAVSAVDEVRRLVVVGMPDVRLGEKLTLVVEGQLLTDKYWQNVQDLVRSRLGPFFVPREQKSLPVFPETVTGKIDRNQIRNSLLNKKQRKGH